MAFSVDRHDIHLRATLEASSDLVGEGVHLAASIAEIPRLLKEKSGLKPLPPTGESFGTLLASPIHTSNAITIHRPGHPDFLPRSRHFHASARVLDGWC